MSSRTMSLACLSEARSTIRRASRNASALSGAWLDSPANREWLSMVATITPDAASLGVEFVNSSDGPRARLVQRQASGDRVQKRGANRLVDRDFPRVRPPGRFAQQHLAELAHHVERDAALLFGQPQVAGLGQRAGAGIHVHPGA